MVEDCSTLTFREVITNKSYKKINSNNLLQSSTHKRIGCLQKNALMLRFQQKIMKRQIITFMFHDYKHTLPYIV